ncbi:hypothetical protein R3P38DRAFT_829606 [Favolaschia claudopus]|uniref:Uncharacterized protein n=1 Tax=Favolaschia claudopus TaxID=2862362 RepID=A0AAW0C0S1_9AGAR
MQFCRPFGTPINYYSGVHGLSMTAACISYHRGQDAPSFSTPMSVGQAPRTVGFRTQLRPFNAAKLFSRLIPANEREKLGTKKRFHDDNGWDDYNHRVKELEAIYEALLLKVDSYTVKLDAVIVTGNRNTRVEGNEDETRMPLSSSSAMRPRDSHKEVRKFTRFCYIFPWSLSPMKQLEDSDFRLQKVKEESSGHRAPRITRFRIQFKLSNAAKLYSKLSPERKKSGLIEKMCEMIRDLTEECLGLAYQHTRVEEIDIGLSNTCIDGELDEPQSSEEERRALIEELLEIQRNTVNIRTITEVTLTMMRAVAARWHTNGIILRDTLKIQANTLAIELSTLAIECQTAEIDTDIGLETLNACIDGNRNETQSSSSAMLPRDLREEFEVSDFQPHRAVEESSQYSLSSHMARHIGTLPVLPIEVTASPNSSQWSLVPPCTFANEGVEIPIESSRTRTLTMDSISFESIHVQDLNDSQPHEIDEESSQNSSYSVVETRTTSLYCIENGTGSSFSLVEPPDQESEMPPGPGLSSPFTVNHMSIGSIRGGIGGGGGQGGRDGGNGGIGAGPQLPISRVDTINITAGTLCLHVEAVHAVHSG